MSTATTSSTISYPDSDSSTAPPKEEFYKSQNGMTVLLNASNYSCWVNDVTILLLADRALGIIEGTEDPPTLVPINQSPAQSTCSATSQAEGHQTAKTYRKLKQNYEETKYKAVAIIYNSICPPMINYIKGMQDPKKMWDTLKAELDTVDARAGAAQLRARFHSLQPDNERLNKYISQLLDYQSLLAHTGDKIDDQAVITHLLETLLPSFETTIENMNNQPDDKKTRNYVFSTLQAAERQIQWKNKISGGSEDFLVRGGGGSQQESIRGRGRGYDGGYGYSPYLRFALLGRGRGCGGQGRFQGPRGSYFCGNSGRGYQGRSNRLPTGFQGRGCGLRQRHRETQYGDPLSSTVEASDVVCYYCCTPDHRVDSCSLKQRAANLRSSHMSSQARAANFASFTEPSHGFIHRAYHATTNSLSSEWVFDSGATNHMCFDFDLFQNFVHFDGHDLYQWGTMPTFRPLVLEMSSYVAIG